MHRSRQHCVLDVGRQGRRPCFFVFSTWNQRRAQSFLISNSNVKKRCARARVSDFSVIRDVMLETVRLPCEFGHISIECLCSSGRRWMAGYALVETKDWGQLHSTRFDIN
jgi:hypothetical protein